MQRNIVIAWLAMLFVLAACRPVTPTSLTTPAGQMETQVATTIYANETSTAAVEQILEVTLTATVPLPTHTPEATPNRFHFSLPASAC